MPQSPADTDGTLHQPGMPWLPDPVLIHRAPASLNAEAAALDTDDAVDSETATTARTMTTATATATATGLRGDGRAPVRAAIGPSGGASQAGQALMWLVVVALLAGGGLVLFRDQLLKAEANYPAAWDARVARIVTFVEQARGLTFRHPIEVEFLSEAEFVDMVSASSGATPDAQTVAAGATVGKLMDAMGAATGYDPLAGLATLNEASTLGFYSPDQDRIVIRGDTLTPGVRLTIAHELTHALQAQHFDITLTDDNDLELRSVLEADAMRIEDQYYATLPADEQAAANVDNTLDPEQAAVLATLPSQVVQVQYAPYRLGPQLLEAVLAQQGNASVDQLLRTPPSELVLIDRSLFGTASGNETLVTVTPPPGATVIEPQRQFSAFEMLVMLDTWVPWEPARDAIDHWRGSGYVSYVRADGLTCFSATISTGAALQLGAALTWWATASHSPTVPVVGVGEVSFEACERGAAAVPTPSQPIATLDALGLEEEIAAAVKQSMINSNDMTINSPTLGNRLRCVARKVMSHPTVEAALLLPTVTPEQQDAYNFAVVVALQDCPVEPLVDVGIIVAI